MAEVDDKAKQAAQAAINKIRTAEKPGRLDVKPEVVVKKKDK